MAPIAPFHKTRLAPTPTGFLHAGNALNFLITATLAKRFDAALLLRIDDLDQMRYRPAYTADIFETIRFLQIGYTEGPQNPTEVEEKWSQRQRLPLYNEALEKLEAGKKVFACTCSRAGQHRCNCRQKQLPLDAPGTCWRLITDDQPIEVTGADGTRTTTKLPAGMKNVVVRRKDGLPAYQLASLVDDLYFGIDFIVRGEDLWPSTLAQLYLATVLESKAFSAIRFLHHPLLKDANGEKLSKSAGAVSVKHWREEGKSRADLLVHLGEWLQTSHPAKSGEDVAKALGV